MDMRIEFEAEMAKQLLSEGYSDFSIEVMLERGSDDEYRSIRVNGAYWGWQASRESLVVELPEITEDHIFFALNCHMEDPSDDEEDGFNAGVRWCRAFLKQQIAEREKK